MASEEHTNKLKRGVKEWNEWIRGQDKLVVDLSGADLRGALLVGINLVNANLRGADLSRAYLLRANLSDANLSDANLSRAILMRAVLIGTHLPGAALDRANLRDANLSRANLNGASLVKADLYSANLRNAALIEANLREAALTAANLTDATLTGASVRSAQAYRTIFADIDLRKVEGLESIKHRGPSVISIGTIYLSEGQIPERFLRGCGVPDEFITQIPALVAAVRPIQFHSCFISYSSKDEEFARRLHERMLAAGLRVWFAPEDIKGGEKLYEQIDRAIQVHDRLLLVLSERSMKSEWVMTELRRARKAEVKENRRKLFPIRLADFDTFREWECFDADQGKDLAVEVREYFIPDFTNWKNHDDFEAAFNRLLNDLKASV